MEARMSRVFVVHFECADDLVIRHVWAGSLDEATEWAEENKPSTQFIDPEYWKVDWVAPANSMWIPVAGHPNDVKTIYFRREHE
jgi:hypothetical protein